MALKQTLTVIDAEGVRGRIDLSSPLPYDGTEHQVIINLPDGSQIVIPTNQLTKQDENNYLLPTSFSALRNQTRETPLNNQETLVVPVIEQQLQVMKRQVETGRVRLTKSVHEREEVVDQPLLQEEVNVERVPINRLVEGPLPEARQEGETTIIPIFEEVLVMEKRVMLKEELRITKRQFETRNPQHVTLRNEEAIVERLEPDNSVPIHTEPSHK